MYLSLYCALGSPGCITDELCCIYRWLQKGLCKKRKHSVEIGKKLKGKSVQAEQDVALLTRNILSMVICSKNCVITNRVMDRGLNVLFLSSARDHPLVLSLENIPNTKLALLSDPVLTKRIFWAVKSRSPSFAAFTFLFWYGYAQRKQLFKTNPAAVTAF